MHHSIFPNQMEDYLVAVLCLWRVTHLLSSEKGPFDLVSHLRVRAGNGFFGELLDCFYCLSLWLAIPLAIFAGDGWAQRVLLWPALSGAACLLEQATKRPNFPGVFEEPKE
jgi:Protein of unknown function (DUF1360)